ncbi:MAG: gamma carbonic anhydrase family protein [Candidatus Nezhaarchaeota archaeon]|nr:gamma carbonic anhydrase family protein [Candidatus Nezhaarchaeota archaeon]
MIRALRGKRPVVHPSAYVDPAAVVIGDVEIGEGSSIWPCAVVRGDVAKVLIGKYTAIEDGVLIHGGGDPSKGFVEPTPVIVGDYCIVGHGAILHSCTIESYVLIGMNAVVHTGSIVGEGSIVAMGSVVEKGQRVPPRTLVAGSPARRIREVGEEVYYSQRKRAEFYFQLARQHMEAIGRVEG